MNIRKNTCLFLDDAPVETWEEMQASYACRRDAHGCSSTTLYYSKESLHRDRLGQVETLLAMHVQPEDALLDVGCGFGDLVPRLPACRYVGIDVIDDFVQEARKRHPEHKFHTANLLDMEISEDSRPDWVAMVGIMGTLPMPEAVLEKGFALARKGLVVDFIDACRYQGPLNHYDLGLCANFLLAQGAAQAHLYATPSQPWTFLVALKTMLFTTS